MTSEWGVNATIDSLPSHSFIHTQMWPLYQVQLGNRIQGKKSRQSSQTMASGLDTDEQLPNPRNEFHRIKAIRSRFIHSPSNWIGRRLKHDNKQFNGGYV